MYVARILYPVEVLGPGKRIGIWFCGCPRRCKGCSNPELWEFQERYKTTPEDIYTLVYKIAAENQIDGFTITGGDPLWQSEDFKKLIKLLSGISTDILVYTGYKIEELSSSAIQGIAVLIDGEYIEEQNNNCILRGSANQRIHILNSSFQKIYSDYCANSSNQIQNFPTADGIISVGIHRPNFLSNLNDAISEKGLLNNDE